MKKKLFLTALLASAVMFSACKPTKVDEQKTEFNPLSETTINVNKEGGACEFKYEIVNPTPTGAVTAKLQDGID